MCHYAGFLQIGSQLYITISLSIYGDISCHVIMNNCEVQYCPCGDISCHVIMNNCEVQYCPCGDISCHIIMNSCEVQDNHCGSSSLEEL